MNFILLQITVLLIIGQWTTNAMLYPRDSARRDHRSLDGVWNFMLNVPENKKKDSNWFIGGLETFDEVILMPVPSSYNDITTDKKIRDHVGPVWYDRTFYVPSTWNIFDSRIWIRFGSVNYAAKVFINGIFVMAHEIGHLPFAGDISNYLEFDKPNRVTVEVDNTLTQFTIPQGSSVNTSTDDGYVLKQHYTFDFFNYAGIHRPVLLFTTPRIFIRDITSETYEIENGVATIDVRAIIDGLNESLCLISLLDKDGKEVTKSTFENCEGQLTVDQPKLWWPYLMDPNPGYMYTLFVKLYDSNEKIEVIDEYRLPIGIRTIRWTDEELLINEKPLYLRGFGKHEDSDIRGKGLDIPLVIKDYNLIKWVGANTYRTSHYPYADEIMDLADQNGIMIIDECPSVDTDQFSDTLLENHKRSLLELYSRDKNHPSVIAWSIANEPRTQTDLAGKYFGDLVYYFRSLEITRPFTLAVAVAANKDKSGRHVDFISFNRYNGWYTNAGQTDMIVNEVVKEAREWNRKFNKPVLIAEYGADTMQGLHLNPGFIWSEEYQVEVLSGHFKAFDQLRTEGFFIGEFIWNFADFKTAQGYTRVGGNKKGIFTREREPKASAHHLRRRYLSLAFELDNHTDVSADIYPYVYKNLKDEL